jgi:hypothetical protein
MGAYHKKIRLQVLRLFFYVLGRDAREMIQTSIGGDYFKITRGSIKSPGGYLFRGGAIAKSFRCQI